MTPAARVASAAEILDLILAGEAAEKCLTTWARKNRYAGSKDRAAIRDHVFQALRCLSSYAALAGAAEAPTGRDIMLGALRAQGIAPESMFSGEGYALSPLTEEELARSLSPVSEAAQHDIPDWLWPQFQDSLGDAAKGEALALRERAPVFLRVNLRKATREFALEKLAEQGIEAQVSDLATTALRVTGGARKVALSEAYAEGLVELQDAASQALAETLPLEGRQRILDYCAGGGGKSLAIAALSDAQVFAHDIMLERMRDISVRAQRAGREIRLVGPEELQNEDGFDLVFCDAPCSGSGAWRRAPEGKWRLTQDRLQALNETQLEVLEAAAQHVLPEGTLAYATCSVLNSENGDVVDGFVRANPEWRVVMQKHWYLGDGADGFYFATFER